MGGGSLGLLGLFGVLGETEVISRSVAATLVDFVLQSGEGLVPGTTGGTAGNGRDSLETSRVGLVLLVGLEGGTASIRDLRGNVVIVNFWGTWCVPCRREIPELVELHEAYEGRPVEIVGIAVDSGDAEDIREFADGFGVEYRLWIAGMETVMSEFEAVGYPFTLIIDQDGGIVSSFYGPQTLASLSGEIDALLP